MTQHCDNTMSGVILLTLVILTIGFSKNVAFTPILLQLETNVNNTLQINNTIEYILQFNITDFQEPPRIWIQSEDANITSPLMIVARQPKEVLSWQLPLFVEGDLGDVKFMTTARILCYDILKNRRLSGKTNIQSEQLFLTISTVSSVNASFTVNVKNQEFFQIKPSVMYNFSISPSEPSYFFYNFSTNLTFAAKDSNYETVILEVESKDDICMTVSIQNVSCPVFDTDQDVTFRGFYETVNRRGGITISKNNFPYGFYVVFVAKSDDYDCTKARVLTSSDSPRVKDISLIIKPSIAYRDYVNAVIFTLCAIGAFYIIFGFLFFFCSIKKSQPRHMDYIQENDMQAHSSRIVRTSATDQGTGTEAALDSISVDETEYDIVDEIEHVKEIRLCRGYPYLTDLARKDPRVLKQKSYLYLYNVLTIAIFYGLPVVQLVIAYQRILNETGQQDLCYYNFLCAHPLGLLSDFNHIFSNIGYILLGVLFVIITYNRELTHRDINFDRHYGIPQHYGMFYAMGVALIMEGVLSGSYHVCPSQSNFQFDSSFMYVMAVLCMVKLYQNRHPDINASAYATFGVLAIAILLGMIGIFEGNTVFWSFFIVIYILTCLYLSIKIYYMGCWSISKSSVRHIYHIIISDFWSGPLNVLKPCYLARFVLLSLGNVCNWGLAFFAIYKHPKNFPVFLLTIFMANTLLYFFFYIVMKYLNKERVRILTWIFLVMSTLCAIAALYFFTFKVISWSKTPAESRQFNRECLLLRFYDSHDIWHFLSATGMFFTFMVLLTLDDDLSHTHHSKIPVF
ncbi:SID1 transmembrane family member 1 isoform X2 [Anoplophora glabripennis]|uniref:SID1 transmembrane family member 1 isoform X2 n=1 Tax=Anoplophora glabripennis TaxID=217634 RepID=UPI00087522EC|nr:SID1 transmembrane family member 1 isoform X2 [Anoplophora glabripennis]